MPQLEPIVNQEEKKLEVPTFNKKEVEEIVREVVKKSGGETGGYDKFKITYSSTRTDDYTEEVDVSDQPELEKFIQILYKASGIDGPMELDDPVFLQYTDDDNGIYYGGFLSLGGTELFFEIPNWAFVKFSYSDETHIYITCKLYEE